MLSTKSLITDSCTRRPENKYAVWIANSVHANSKWLVDRPLPPSFLLDFSLVIAAVMSLLETLQSSEYSADEIRFSRELRISIISWVLQDTLFYSCRYPSEKIREIQSGLDWPSIILAGAARFPLFLLTSDHRSRLLLQRTASANHCRTISCSFFFTRRMA